MIDWISWQLVYWVAQIVTIAAFARIGAKALERYIETREDEELQDGHFLLWIFIAIAVLFLAKDAFWTTVVFRRDWLPLPLRDPLPLSLILAAIQLTAAGLFTWFWEILD